MKKRTFYERYTKRILDVVCIVCAFVLFSPVFLITALLVRIKLGSPILFTQDRPGKDGKIFKLYKFRSMTNAKDKNGNLLPDDERLTPFGKMLRSTSLDEIPELFNIMNGNMSLVGPRPLLVEYLPYYTKEEKHRHDVRPGLTGLAQINGRNTLTWEEKFAYDIQYVNNITFCGDVAIIIKTIVKVFRRADILIGKEFKVAKLIIERANWELTPDGAIKPTEKNVL